MGNNLCDTFPIQNDLKQGDVIVIAFQFIFRICHQKGPKYQEGFQLNGTHQLLIFADDGNILCQNINTIKENKEALLQSSMEVGLEVSREKIKYVIVPYQQNAKS
jgi:hypothetical protein